VQGKCLDFVIDAGNGLASRMVHLYLADGAEGKPMAAECTLQFSRNELGQGAFIEKNQKNVFLFIGNICG